MFVGIVYFPPVKPGKEADFFKWFSWSNSQFGQQKGFIRRRLIKQYGDQDKFAAVIEFDRYENFKAVADQPFHADSARQLALLVEGMPAPAMFEEIMG